MAHKRRKRNPLIWVAYALLALLVVLAVYLVAMKASNRIPSVFGYSVLRVISPSMEDTIPTGAYILIQKTDPNEIAQGDVITFYSTDPAIYMQANTHRVIKVDNTGGSPVFTTKGDNNPIPDDTTVQKEHLIGRYRCNLPVLTKIGGVFQNKTVFLLLVLVPAALFLISELINVARVSHGVREQTRKEAFLVAEKARIKAEEEKQDGKNKKEK